VLYLFSGWYVPSQKHAVVDSSSFYVIGAKGDKTARRCVRGGAFSGLLHVASQFDTRRGVGGLRRCRALRTALRHNWGGPCQSAISSVLSQSLVRGSLGVAVGSSRG
jgi:hypothetical protein